MVRRLDSPEKWFNSCERVQKMSVITKRRTDDMTAECLGIDGQNMIRHIYVHIPFCARICPYCAFYKELLDRSQTQRFCEALLSELRQQTKDRPAFARPTAGRHLLPSTIYFGGGTPTALTTGQL